MLISVPIVLYIEHSEIRLYASLLDASEDTIYSNPLTAAQQGTMGIPPAAGERKYQQADYHLRSKSRPASLFINVALIDSRKSSSQTTSI